MKIKDKFFEKKNKIDFKIYKNKNKKDFFFKKKEVIKKKIQKILPPAQC